MTASRGSSQPLRLFWNDSEIGRVSNVSGDYPWMSGEFTLTTADQRFPALFAFMVQDDAGDPPFDDELLEEEAWSLLDSEGNRKGISLPAVHLDDASIEWRWR